MFKRIILEDWQNIVPFFSFGTAFLIFLFGVAIAVFSKKEKNILQKKKAAVIPIF